MMRTVLAIIVYLCSLVQASAQDRYFLCIQSEDKQPFYVRVSHKTWSSSAVGNLVVPGLGDSTYEVSIGFPPGKYPEQNFLITFNRKDLGYTLKKGGDQGWTLLNWENGERLSPRAGQPVETIWYGERKKDDAFTHMMAAVVNDSAVLYVASVKDLPGKQEVFAAANPAPGVDKHNAIADGAVVTAATNTSDTAVAAQAAPDSVQVATAGNTKQTVIDSTTVETGNALAAATKDSIASGLTAVRDSAAAIAEKNAPILVYSAPKPSVTMVKDHILPKGRSMLFIDSSASGVDSISVIIDADPDTIKNMAVEQATQPAESPLVKSASPDPDTSARAGANPVAATAPSLPAGTTAPAETTEGKKDPVAEPAPEKKKLVLINSDCSNFATDNDIDKLRVRILDEPTIDSKLAATKKLFKSKCIYTRQIRALSELFLNDEARYRFFEQCYPFTADTSEFRSLITLLSEETYIARFKALVRMKD